MAHESALTDGLHTNCALSVDVFINQHGHYYCRVTDCSDGSVRWHDAIRLSSEDEQRLEDAFIKMCAEAAEYLEKNMKEILG